MTPIFKTPEQIESAFTSRLDAFSRSANDSECFVFSYSFTQYYLPDSPVLTLLACVALSVGCSCENKVVANVAVLNASEEVLAALESVSNTPADMQLLAERFGAAWVDMSKALMLKPIAIAKPWGQEIWYTGIEARGQSVVVGEGIGETPLPWLLSFAPKWLAGGCERNLCLLKVLDPLPDEVYGDLYFEMHEEKREVYVVTHVDPEAWPDGSGGIRFGFNQQLRKELGDAAFTKAYFDAVKAYEEVRREIDTHFDERRQQLGVATNEPLAADVLKEWHGLLPVSLQEQELLRRRSMESFTAMKALALGDVVKVPCFTPHSLQHGVRTIEFQTPVYERKILSFAQKVLTQTHWDTEQALDLMSLDEPQDDPLPLLSENKGCRIEQVVRFDDFEVLRISLGEGAECDLQAYLNTVDYALIMPVAGEAELARQALSLQNALLLGQGWLAQNEGDYSLRASVQSVTILLALPINTALA